MVGRPWRWRTRSQAGVLGFTGSDQSYWLSTKKKGACFFTLLLQENLGIFRVEDELKH